MEEETQNSETLDSSQPETNSIMQEFPLAEENPHLETLINENPSMDFVVPDQFLVGSSKIDCLQSKEGNPDVEIGDVKSPVVKAMEIGDASSNSLQFDQTLDGSSNIEEMKCSEDFAEIDQKGGDILDVAQFAKTLGSESVNEENTSLTVAEIMNAIDETGKEDSPSMEATDLAKTLTEVSPSGNQDVPIFGNTGLDENVEDSRLYNGPWSEGQFRNRCHCGNCLDNEEMCWRDPGIEWPSPRWNYTHRGHHPKRHCKRRGFHNPRRDREAEFYGLSWNDCIGEPQPEPCPVGAGLANLGNTCFLNAILQCFTHTVPLVQRVLSLKHDKSMHGVDEFCVLCAVRNQIEYSFVHSGQVISPSYLVDNLSNISSFFRRYQQEDAHEFLQCLLDKLGSNWLKYEAPEAVSSLPVNTLVEQIFGGCLLSQVRCCKCGHSSDTYEPLIDLSLEIEDVDNLESALKSFTKVESIEVTEKFTCDGCKEQVEVEKQLMLDRVPSVAALHLKRFKSDGILVEKIDKRVDFPVELDLSPYTKGSNEGNEDLKYELFAVVVHVGFSSTSGHYFCYICTSPQKWYRFDDSQVTMVDEGHVLCQDAYILFYAKKGTPWFDNLFENWKVECREKISSTSPKSVLDDMNLPSTSYSVGPDILGCNAIGETSTTPSNELNKVEGQCEPDVGTALNGCDADKMRAAVGDAFIQPAIELGKDAVGSKAGGDSCVSAVAKKTWLSVVRNNNYDEVRTGKNDSKLGAVLLSENYKATKDQICCEKIGDNEQTSCGGASPSHIENKYDEPRNEGGIKPSTPLRALSPGIYSDEDTAEDAYCIPIKHLKIEEKPPSAKKSANSLKQDDRRKEATKYIRRAMPGARGQLLLAAMNGPRSDSLLSKKRRKQGTCLHNRHSKKRVKVSPKRVLRPVTA